MTPIAIAGLKHHQDRCLLVMEAEMGAFLELAQVLSTELINLCFLAFCPGGGLTLGLERRAGSRALELAARIAAGRGLAPPHLSPPVAFITVYPMAGGLLLPLAAGALLRSGFTPLAVGTSLSAAVLAVEEAALEPAVAALLTELHLPPGASPAREGVHVVQTPQGAAVEVDAQTVAVYAERPVGCYGVKAQPDQAVASHSLDRGRMWQVVGALDRLPPPGRPCFISAAGPGSHAHLCASLPLDEARGLAAGLAGGVDLPVTVRPAALFHLQGPHFGDRYGIAAAALAGLAEAEVTPLAVSAVVHSLFLAVAPEDVSRAAAGLAGWFRPPEC